MKYPDIELERRIASRLLDVLIRAGLILALVMLCFQVFSPFLNLMIWALILAVTLYPAAPVAGRQARRPAGTCGDADRAARSGAGRRADGRADELARRLGARAHQRRAEQHARRCRLRERPSPTGRWSARRCTPSGPGAHRSAGTGAEHAAEDRQPRQGGARLRGQHRRRAAAVPRLPRRRRHHDGLR